MHKEFFSGISFGAMQSFGSVAVLPLISPPSDDDFNYITLSEAIILNLIHIAEVSKGGKVTNLKVISNADLPVLLLSGEEVKGAKQNRILNTSILMPAKSELIIPVSCTESGRWRYEVSPTRAMADAFHHRSHDLEEALRQFRLLPGQTGVFFFHSGKAAGLDILSSPAAFARLHDKLVRSYVIDCLDSRSGSWRSDVISTEARRFLDSAGQAEVQIFKSPGLGNGLRLSAPNILGSILTCDEQPIHACLFHNEAEKDHGIVRYYRRKKL